MKIGTDYLLGRQKAVLYLYTHSVTDMRATDLTNSNYCYTVILSIWWKTLKGRSKRRCEVNIRIYLKEMWSGIVVCFTLVHSLELTPTNDELVESRKEARKQGYCVGAFVKGLNKKHTGTIYDCTVNDVITSYMHTRTISSHQRYSRMMKGAHSLR